MSSRVSRGGAAAESEESKYGGSTRSTPAKEEAKRAARKDLEAAKRSIDRAEAELDEAAGASEGEHDASAAEGEDAATKATRGAKQAKRAAEDKAGDLKDKAGDLKSKATAAAEDAKEKGKQAVLDLQAKGQQVAKDLQRKGEGLAADAEEAVDDATASAKSRGSRASDKLQEGADKAREGLNSARRGAEDAADSAREGLNSAKRTVKGKAAAASEEVEKNTAGWQESLKSQASELLHTASDAASSAAAQIRTRVADAVPGVQKSIEKGIKVAKAKLAAADVQDDEVAASGSDSQQEEEQEQGEDEEESSASEGEQQQGVEGQARSLANRAKGKAAAASSSVKGAAARGKKALQDAADSASAQAEQVDTDELADRARSAGSRAQQGARQTLNDAKSSAKSAVQSARESGERAVGKARKRVEEATPDEDELDHAAEQAQDTARQGLNKARNAAQNIKGKAQQALGQAKDKFNLSGASSLGGGSSSSLNDKASRAGAQARSKLNETGDRVREGAARLRHRASDALHGAEEEEDAEESDAQFRRAAGRGINKFNRVVEKDDNMRIPLAILALVALVWILGAAFYKPQPPPPPASLGESVQAAFHDARTYGQDLLHRAVPGIVPPARPPTWGETLSGWKNSIFGTRPPVDAATVRDSVRQGLDSAQEAAYAAKHTLDTNVIPHVRDGIRYTQDTILPTARDGLYRAGEEVQYHREHAGDYVDAARAKAEELNLLQKQSLGARVWAWVTGSETIPQQAARRAGELKDTLADSYDKVKDALPSQHKSLADRLRAHLPGYHEETLIEKAQRNIQGLNPQGTAEEYYARALAAGYELKDGAYKLTHRSLADRIKAHLPGHRDTLLDKVERNIPNIDVSGTAQDYYARALAAGYELKDGIYQQTHRSLADRLKAILPGHKETTLEKVQRNIPHIDPKGTAQEYYARALEAGYELKDGVYKATHRSLADKILDLLPGRHDTLLDKVQRNIPNIDPKGTAEEYYAKALAAGYELKDGVYQMTHRSLADRIKAHLPGHQETLLEKAQRNIDGLDPKGSARDYYARALEKGYELKDGVYQLSHRSLEDRIRDHLPGHHSVLERAQRNIQGLDPSGTAQEYYAKALEAGYELKDGLYQKTHRSLADRIRAHLPFRKESWLDKVERNVPHLDVSGTAQDYYDRAVTAGYELKDGAYKLTHRSLADRIKAHLPGHQETLYEKAQRNVADIDPSGSARDYYARALAAGYELKDGIYQRTHRSLADRIRAHLPGHHDTLLDQVQRNIPNVDPKGTAQDYYARALAAGYELRDGAYKLTHRSLADRLSAHLPFHKQSPIERAQRTIEGLDASGTAQEYYAKALEKGYELKDGIYQRTHRSLADRIRDHLPGRDTTLDKVQRNIPNIDVSGTAQDYYARALEAGYELKDGVYQLSHRSLADRIKSHIPKRHASLRDSLSDSLSNLDAPGSAKAYFERKQQQAQGVGAELRQGAQQLKEHVRTGVPGAVHEARDNYQQHQQQQQQHNYGQQQQQYGYEQHVENANVHPTRTTENAVPIGEVRATTAHAEAQPDPLAHRAPMPADVLAQAQQHQYHQQQHAAGVTEEQHKQTLAQQIANGIKVHLPGMHANHIGDDVHHATHHAEKEVEYAAHRAKHEAEAAAHRAEEAAKYAQDNVERHL